MFFFGRGTVSGWFCVVFAAGGRLCGLIIDVGTLVDFAAYYPLLFLLLICWKVDGWSAAHKVKKMHPAAYELAVTANLREVRKK